MSQAQIAETDRTRQVREILAATFNLPVDDVPADARQGELPNWDSLGQLNLVMELEGRFDVSFTTEQVLKMRCVDDIVATLKEIADGH